MKTNQTLNTNYAIGKPEELAYFRKKCLQDSKLMEFYISPEEEKEWITFREKINQILFNKNSLMPIKFLND